MSDKKTLYERFGGYDAITAVANDLLSRVRADPQVGRFWAHGGEDGVNREKQLLIDFLCASAGGPMYYRGRDMVLCHRGMRISESDWSVPWSRRRDPCEIPGAGGRTAPGVSVTLPGLGGEPTPLGLAVVRRAA